MKNYYLLLLLGLFGLIFPSTASNPYRFRTMSPEGGFYYDGVNAIEQDKVGFIWISMDYELYRFDGYRYKKYYAYFAAIEPTKRWVFRNMASHPSGHLYVSTNNGLYRYTPLADSFERVFHEVSNVKVDEEERIWVHYRNRWSILDTETWQIHTPEYDGRKTPYANQAFCQHRKEVYTFVHRDVYRFDEAKKRFMLCFTLSDKRGGRIRSAQARNGKLWLLTEQGELYKTDLATFRIEAHWHPLSQYKGNPIRAFHVDKKEDVWLGSIDGMYVFTPQTEHLTHYTYSSTDPFSLPNNSVWKIFEDRQSNIWIGTYSGKLCYVNINESQPFKSYNTFNSGLSHTPVSAFAEEDKYLWIGTEGGGVNRMEKATGEIISFSEQIGINGPSNIKSLMIDGQHNLWVSTFREGMRSYTDGRQKGSAYRHVAKDSTSLLVNNIRKIIADGDSGMWVAYQHYLPVISYFSHRNQTFTHYNLDSARQDVYLFDILRQGEETLWSLGNEALYRMDITTGHVEKIHPNDSTYLGLFTFCLDDAGDLWIGTIGNGLIKFDTHASRFIPLDGTLRNEIYSVYSICYDKGSIWMGTDDGLYCYNIADNRLMKFDQRENTQGQVYYPLASMKGKDGLLYFGGTQGLTVIDPTQISYNHYQPEAIISDFFIDHKSVHPHHTLEHSLTTITLEHDQTNFGFQFSSDNYHIPEKNRFKYRLKGYNNSWITANALQRTVMYSKVPAGTYYFEVYAANNDGVWGETPTVIKVVRKTAPWLSWPARLLYLFIAIGVIWMVYRHFTEKKRLKILLYQENVEKEKKEQIHQAQLRFFTNISHDFRTPLSLIMAALDKLRREGLKEYYYRILHGNVQRLLNLVNELMDFRTVENGMMKLELELVDVNSFVKDIAADFADYAMERKIDFRIECDETLPEEIYADKNVMEKIVLNLLNNAFKYTQNGGSIVLTTLRGKGFESQWSNSYQVGECKEEVFSLIVSDTGVGISGESISSVFERFYKVNTVNTDSHLGTGIGLALVKSLVLLQKGSISIHSEREKGTDMVVSLPMDSSVFKECDFIKQSANPIAEGGLSLPAKESLHNATEEPEKIQIAASARKILLVEDNTDLRTLIAEALSEEFQVTQAGDGIEALKEMENVDFDLVISDIMMPRKDGVSLCNDIKGNVTTSHIPVILLTAKTSLESKIEGVDSGADLYFEKPIDLTYLKLSIENIFKSRQQLKEHYAKNYYADSSELATNEQDNKFLKQLIEFVEEHMDQPDMDVNQIAEGLTMSRSKLYTKVKSLTDKSVVEFVLSCRLRKAAKLIIEENITMREVMSRIGIESQPYFTNSFKKTFGETPTSFASKHKKRK